MGKYLLLKVSMKRINIVFKLKMKKCGFVVEVDVVLVSVTGAETHSLYLIHVTVLSPLQPKSSFKNNEGLLTRLNS